MVLFGGACVVLFRGSAWFYLGGMRGFFRYNEIRSMSGQYASYWNAYLLYKCKHFENHTDGNLILFGGS